MGPVIDCDTHLMEPAGMWREYADPSDRDVTLRLAEDQNGHAWLWLGDRRIELAFLQVPGDTEQVGEQVVAARRGEPARYRLADVNPERYTSPGQRVQFLDAQGLDAAVLFPNYGLIFEGPLSADLRAVKANMGAWNRYAIEVRQAGHGRLHPVGHLTLRDPEWCERQLAALGAGDVRLAMIAPASVDGKRLSHPDLERVWVAFVRHGVAPVFHVGAFQRPFDPAWYEGDPDPVNPVITNIFLGTPAQLALADLAIHGTLEAFPDLRIGVMELSAVWVPLFLLTLDGGFDFHARFNGAPLTELPMRPSDYIRRQVRVAAFSYEAPDRLIGRAGDLFMMCSDYPHSEGTDTVLADYRRSCPAAGTPEQAPGLFGGNAAWLLRLD